MNARRRADTQHHLAKLRIFRKVPRDLRENRNMRGQLPAIMQSWMTRLEVTCDKAKEIADGGPLCSQIKPMKVHLPSMNIIFTNRINCNNWFVVRNSGDESQSHQAMLEAWLRREHGKWDSTRHCYFYSCTMCIQHGKQIFTDIKLRSFGNTTLWNTILLVIMWRTFSQTFRTKTPKHRPPCLFWQISGFL